jgi:hypothetical protein
MQNNLTAEEMKFHWILNLWIDLSMKTRRISTTRIITTFAVFKLFLQPEIGLNSIVVKLTKFIRNKKNIVASLPVLDSLYRYLDV